MSNPVHKLEDTIMNAFKKLKKKVTSIDYGSKASYLVYAGTSAVLGIILGVFHVAWLVTGLTAAALLALEVVTRPDDAGK